MSEIKKVFKWWPAWKPEKMEAWLEEMEANGWRLVQVKWSATRFYFEKGEPRKVRYCLDYQTEKDASYARLFQDSGWEMTYTNGMWYIWKMPYSAERPEIYSDLDSLIERNKRLMNLFGLIALIQVPAIVVNMERLRDYPVFALVYVFLIGMLGYGFFRTRNTNIRLKKRSGGWK